MSKLTAFKNADWTAQLRKTYPGAIFKGYSVLKVGKRPGYRVNFQLGNGANLVNHYIVNVYAKYYSYSIQMAHSDNTTAASVAKDAAEFTKLLNNFNIGSNPAKKPAYKAF